MEFPDFHDFSVGGQSSDGNIWRRTETRRNIVFYSRIRSEILAEFEPGLGYCKPGISQSSSLP